uniref:Connectin-like n=1 Tax=Diabrotica virgifera virgifera TaxID=50390 RepID=A0A6P7EZY0_DIAVI
MKLATVLAVLWVSEASLKELRSRNKSKTISSSPDNICNLEPSHNDNIRCFCTKDKYHQVSSAECWIFGSVTKDNFMWKLIIESQPYLAEFSVISSKNGDLSSIPKYFSSRMLFLKNLTVTFGVIETVEKFAFGNSTSLQKLILAQNQIKYLDQFSISNLLSLTELDLSENNIKLIHPAVFLNVPQLKYVRLNKNNITKIEDKAFAGLGNALDLDLSENLLCDINNMTFFGLSKLKVIDLSMNRIIGLTSSVFLELWDIEELYLDDNNIEFISNRAFDGLRFLKTLSLKNNRLSRFPAGLFTSVFTLVHLDLSYNRLETLVFDSIEQFYNNLLHNGTIHLKGNRFSCDCRLDWVYILYQKTAQGHIRKSLEELNCSFQSDRIPAKESIEHLVCPPKSDDYTYQKQTNEISNMTNDIHTHKINLLSMPVKKLPCPPEYRPTPITVKQGHPQGSEISSNCGVYFKSLHVIYIGIFVFLV